MPTDEELNSVSQVEAVDDPKADTTSEDDSNESLADTTHDESIEVQETHGDESTTSEDDDDEALVPLSKLKKARNEARNLRDRLRTAEARIIELEASDSSTIEDKTTELLVALRSERLDRVVSDLANKFNALEPTALSKLIHESDVEWADDKPTNVEDVITKLRSTYPRLFTSYSANGNAGTRDERGIDEQLSPQARMKAAFSSNS